MKRNASADNLRNSNDSQEVDDLRGDVADQWLADAIHGLTKTEGNNSDVGGLKLLRTILRRVDRIEQTLARQPNLAERLARLENEVAAVAARRRDPNETPDRRVEREITKLRILIAQAARTAAAVADFLGDEPTEIHTRKFCRLAGVSRS